MLKVEFDAKTGLYRRYTESLKADDVLSDIAGLVIAFDRDFQANCGEETACFYRKVLRKALDTLDEEEERGQVLQ